MSSRIDTNIPKRDRKRQPNIRKAIPKCLRLPALLKCVADVQRSLQRAANRTFCGPLPMMIFASCKPFVAIVKKPPEAGHWGSYEILDCLHMKRETKFPCRRIPGNMSNCRGADEVHL